MSTARLTGRRGDGSAAVRGWVAIYTFGLPAAIRERRRGEVASDLAEETLDAIRRAETAGLRRRRLVRLLLGIPDDLAWRLVDAPAAVRQLRAVLPPTTWVPLTRSTLFLLSITAIGAAGALGIVVVPLVDGSAPPDAWLGWGPYGFITACAIVLAAVVLAVAWPVRGLRLGIAGVVIGMAAAPWLGGCWLLVFIALFARWYQASRLGGPAA